ncbi:hypothetical protein CL614_07695 [archaeon]|nr:hypothetical protein [archaeon]|tara:strand:+ start:95 stop:493 length:399 start_codon:yes stop_codon:yes gene_type:complete
MANQIPLKALFDENGNVTSLGQFTTTDTVSVADGGTGVTAFTIGNIIIGNGTNGFQSLARGSLLAGDASVTVTNGTNAVVGGNVLVSFNTGNIDIAQTSGFLPAGRVSADISDQWIESVIPTIDGNEVGGDF